MNPAAAALETLTKHSMELCRIIRDSADLIKTVDGISSDPHVVDVLQSLGYKRGKDALRAFDALATRLVEPIKVAYDLHARLTTMIKVLEKASLRGEMLDSASVH